jgi:alpha-L-fucosidase
VAIECQRMLRRDLLKAIGSVPLAAAAAYPRQSLAGLYQPKWESIDKRPIPRWYTDAKFGIFIHWGVYSVPAFAPVNVKNQTPYAEWYWHSLTEGRKGKQDGDGALTWQYHKRMYGANFPYADFAPQFRAELFDPDHWADVFVRSGAKYVALTSKHHEGFTLWKSAEANRSWGRPWNSTEVGAKRDLLLDLTTAGRRRGLHMGIYYSLYEWYNPLWLTDKARYVREHMTPQFKDVVNHATPDIIFSDGEWELTSSEWHSEELLAWLYNDSPVAGNVVIDDRWGKDTRHKHGGYYTTEYTSGMQASAHPWEESRGMGFSYGYNRMETLKDYHSERQLLLMLIDIVSRGGNLLLDIGPRADGQIPVIMEERLIQMGDWLRANGDAIYGTVAHQHPAQWSEGTRPHMEDKEFMGEYDILKIVDNPQPGYAHVEAFFTAKGDAVYAILPQWRGSEFVLRDFPAFNGKITLLETGDQLEWKGQNDTVVISMPQNLRAKLPPRQAYTLKLS